VLQPSVAGKLSPAWYTVLSYTQVLPQAAAVQLISPDDWHWQRLQPSPAGKDSPMAYWVPFCSHTEAHSLSVHDTVPSALQVQLLQPL